MKQIVIGNQELEIKDYYCSDTEEYTDRLDGRLWLYVNVTDICNGTCPFCINPSVKEGRNKLDLYAFKDTLEKIKDYIYGVSLTGGEPMLYPDLINDVLETVHETCGIYVEKDIVTNGTGFESLLESLDLTHLDSVHLSRHMITDGENNQVFGFSTATTDDIESVVARLEDPALIVLNCVLMRSGIDSTEKMAEYLDFASDIGIRNVCFIGLSRHNTFCMDHFIDPGQIDLSQDKRFHIWNKYHDHEYCSCSSGSYDGKHGSIRFYFRRVGDMKAPYARQLVFMPDNRLLAGFSGKEIQFGNR